MRYIECFGFTFEDIGEEGATSLETKMRSAGMPIDELPGPPVFPVDGHAARARRARPQDGARRVTSARSSARPRRTRRTCRLFFEVGRRRAGHGAPREPGAIQWEFKDAEPWHVVVANGDTRAVRGRADDPRVTFKTTFEDFVDVVAGREDPRKLVLRGRLRPRGDLRWLCRSRGMFPS